MATAQHPFSTIYFDFSGTCNARCRYCNTGLYAESKGTFISPEKFALAIDKLLQNNIYDRNSYISLYCWGEPFLHPQLNELIDILNSKNIKYAFSTNGSRIPNINSRFVRGLRNIVFSMSGFTQTSYDKIHGFKFDQIIKNIVSIVKTCRQYGYKGKFSISFHTYQFNADELFECEKFANKYRIQFNPVNAIQNTWHHTVLNAKNELPANISDLIYKDLFYDNFREIVSSSQSSVPSFKCPMVSSMLVIDEACNVLQCCQVPSGDTYSPGNLLTDDWASILKRKNLSNPICVECTQSGIAEYFQKAYKVPDFYKSAVLHRPRIGDIFSIPIISLKYPRLFSLLRKIKNYIPRP